MSTKIAKISYWTSTGLLALFILPGIFFINSPMAKEGAAHLLIPGWLATTVGIGSFIGGLILIIPKLPAWLKEWGYVGLGIVYVSALIGHLAIDGPIPMSFSPLLNLVVLLISYFTYHRVHTSVSHS